MLYRRMLRSEGEGDEWAKKQDKEEDPLNIKDVRMRKKRSGCRRPPSSMTGSSNSQQQKEGDNEQPTDPKVQRRAAAAPRIIINVVIEWITILDLVFLAS